MAFRSLLISALFVGACQSERHTSAGHERRLAIQPLIGYLPRNQITDHAALDLDQKSMEEELFLERLIKARNVYEQGGHSGSYAELKLIAPEGPAHFYENEQVFGVNEYGGEVSGRLIEELEIAEGNVEDIIVKVRYTTSDVQEKYVGCQVGGLFTFSQANRDGCYNDTGTVLFLQRGQRSSEGRRLAYSYNPRINNNNDRTLQGLSTTAHRTMKNWECTNCDYIHNFQNFVDYYGDTDYADKWVVSASEHMAVEFSSGRGSADFSLLHSKQALAEAMAKGTVILHVLMYIIRELNSAVVQCEERCDDCSSKSVRSLDQAVAFYAGSLQGEDGYGPGRLMFQQANQRALNFRTAGEFGTDDEGVAYVNLEVVRSFKRMQLNLLQGDCGLAATSKDTIINYMKVPLVQGVLRYAYIRAFENPSEADLSEKAEAEGATYAAAVLPFVHTCDRKAAEVIYRSMRIGSDPASISFTDVKKALEKNYECMGIKCSHVGGIWTVNGYSSNAEPCGDLVEIGENPNPQSTSAASDVDANQTGSSSRRGLITGIMLGVLFAVALAMMAYSLSQQRKRRFKDERRRGSENIAAVSEIIT